MHERCLITIVALLFALPVGAQIYRCEADGVIAFSDRPCGPDPSVYSQAAGISFVTPDENLPAIAEATQAFIRARREQLARENESERRSQPAPTPVPAQQTIHTVFLPWLHPGLPQHRHRRGHDRLDDTEPPVVADNDRYSPLNGPILGTRRDPMFPRRPRPGSTDPGSIDDNER